MADFREVFVEGMADAALAASVFHFQEIQIPRLKEYLREEGITPEGSYQATWEAIQQGEESLRRHSNLLLLFT